MSFDARHPDAAIHSRETTPYSARLVPARVPASVLAKVGETFAGALSQLQQALAALGSLAPPQQPVLDAGLAEIARLEQLGVQIQELARVLAGDAPMAPERVDLARAAREALAQWKQAAQRRGVELRGPLESFELEVDAAVLEQLLDLGLEYALNIGSRIEVDAGRQGIPPHPMLTIQVQRSQELSGAGAEEDFNELHWLLFAHLARAVGLAPQRVAAGKTVTLMLGFPSSDAPGEAESAPSQAQLPRSAPVVGRRVLLLEPQDAVRVYANRLMREVGMQVDATATIGQARASLRDGAPDVVVTGMSVDDLGVAALLDDVRAARPRLRVVELVDDDNAFSFSEPGSDSPARVGRNDMAQTLVRAISQELDAA